jgi:hypothetical protein
LLSQCCGNESSSSDTNPTNNNNNHNTQSQRDHLPNVVYYYSNTEETPLIASPNNNHHHHGHSHSFSLSSAYIRGYGCEPDMIELEDTVGGIVDEERHTLSIPRAIAAAVATNDKCDLDDDDGPLVLEHYPEDPFESHVRKQLMIQ